MMNATQPKPDPEPGPRLPEIGDVVHTPYRRLPRDGGGLGVYPAIVLAGDAPGDPETGDFARGPDGQYVLGPDGRLLGARDEVCHSYVRNGRIEFLPDCTHAMAGQTVELERW